MLGRREFLKMGCWGLAATLFLSRLNGLTTFDFNQVVKGSMRLDGLRLTDQDIMVEEARYYSQLDNNMVGCELCFRGCRISPGERGFCQVRKNHEGKLYSLVYGNMGTVTVGPVEKKPLHQYRPGARANNYGTAGCNLSCKFCHNWMLSQQKLEELDSYQHYMPQEAVEYALQREAKLISFTYNEPTVFIEFMLETAQLAREQGLGVNVNTNALLAEKPLQDLMSLADSATVDLKGFSQDFYREICQGELDPVLKNLQRMKEMGVWVEVVNLIIPGLNDQEEMIQNMCRWFYEQLGPQTPLHLNRFVPAYRLQNIAPTPVGTLERARDIAVQEGLDFVYIGNVPGHTYNSTFCPGCNSVVVERHHFSVYEVKIEDGKCRYCGQVIAGVW